MVHDAAGSAATGFRIDTGAGRLGATDSRARARNPARRHRPHPSAIQALRLSQLDRDARYPVGARHGARRGPIVLNNQEKAFANGPGWEYFIGPFFNRGIMLLDFEEHLQHKQIMQQAFTRDMLRRYSIGLDAGITRGIAAWQPGPKFALYDAVKQLLLDLATEVFVGAELGAQADRINEAFVDTVVAGLSIVRADVPGGGWHRGLTGRALLEEYSRELLPAKRASEVR